MDTIERIIILRRAGLSAQAVAAILNVDYAEVQDAAFDPADVPEVGGDTGGGGITGSVENIAEQQVASALNVFVPAPTPDLVTVELTEFKVVSVYARAQVKSPEGDWCTAALFHGGVKLGEQGGGSASQWQQLILGRTATAAQYGLEGGAAGADRADFGGGVAIPLEAGTHVFELRYFGNTCHMQKRALAVAA